MISPSVPSGFGTTGVLQTRKRSCAMPLPWNAKPQELSIPQPDPDVRTDLPRLNLDPGVWDAPAPRPGRRSPAWPQIFHFDMETTPLRDRLTGAIKGTALDLSDWTKDELQSLMRLPARFWAALDQPEEEQARLHYVILPDHSADLELSKSGLVKMAVAPADWPAAIPNELAIRVMGAVVGSRGDQLDLTGWKQAQLDALWDLPQDARDALRRDPRMAALEWVILPRGVKRAGLFGDVGQTTAAG